MEYIMRKNGFCKGIQLKRKPTWDETNYCLTEILGFDMDFALYMDRSNDEYADEDELEEYKKDVENEKKEIHKTFIKFIKGDCTWHWLCDTLYCYDDIEEFTIGNIAYLLKYLQEKEII